MVMSKTDHKLMDAGFKNVCLKVSGVKTEVGNVDTKVVELTTDFKASCKKNDLAHAEIDKRLDEHGESIAKMVGIREGTIATEGKQNRRMGVGAAIAQNKIAIVAIFISLLTLGFLVYSWKGG